MDGTLLNSNNEVSERTRQAILEAGEKGIHVILSTGRLLPSAIKYSYNIGLKRPIISSNGAIIIDENQNIIYEKSIHKDIVESITQLADKNNLYYHFYTKDSFYSNQYVEDIIEFYNPRGIRQEDKIKFNLYKDIKEVLDRNIEVYKFIFIDNDTKKLYKLREELKSIKNVNVCSSWSNNVEVMQREVSKGNSLKYQIGRAHV